MKEWLNERTEYIENYYLYKNRGIIGAIFLIMAFIGLAILELWDINNTVLLIIVLILLVLGVGFMLKLRKTVDEIKIR